MIKLKIYKTYACEICGKESKVQEEIELCEAQHIGLNTIEEKHDYDYLDFNVQHLSHIVNSTNNEQTRQELDTAIEKLLQFEKEHNMKVK